MKYIYLILLLVGLSGCSNCEKLCKFNEKDITDMYSSYVEEWKNEANASFDKAEKEIFVIKPDPKPNVIIGPDPDPLKCICKGTGIIVQGDDHKTLCPFHGVQSSNVKKDVRTK